MHDLAYILDSLSLVPVWVGMGLWGYYEHRNASLQAATKLNNAHAVSVLFDGEFALNQPLPRASNEQS